MAGKLAATIGLTAIAVLAVGAQQTFTGRLSDSACGASHQATAAAAGLTDRQCLLACIHKLAKYVLVNERDVKPIANQDAMGLPLYAGRPVKLTGEVKGEAIVVTRVEAIAAHLHLLHVTTNWRDTPGGRGFLPVAADEARVAVLHARLAAKSERLDDVRLHAAHVLHALDPAIEPKGPGAGYGVRRAAAGAVQHLEMAVAGEGTTPNIVTEAARVTSALTQALHLTAEAIDVAQKIRAASDAAEATRAAADLVVRTQRLADEALQAAETQMTAILKAEGLLGVPR